MSRAAGRTGRVVDRPERRKAKTKRNRIAFRGDVCVRREDNEGENSVGPKCGLRIEIFWLRTLDIN